MKLSWNTNTAQPQCIIALAPLPEEISAIPTTRLTANTLDKLPAFNALRQKQYLANRSLLAELLYQLLAIETLPEITVHNNGRPQFVQAGLPDFNISHSDNYVMVALAQHCQIGADLEMKRERRRLLDLARYSFSPLEVSWLEQQETAAQTDSFWQLWTIRESILKLAAKGVWQMKAIEIDPFNHTLTTPFSESLYCWHQQQDDIAWSISTDRVLTLDNIALFQVNQDYSQLVPQPLSNLVMYRSVSSR